MSVKIIRFELYDFKRVRAVACEPTDVGLTVIGGKSRQGKTSIPDGIAWCLGGDRNKPEKPQRDGAAKPPELTVTLNNGLVVTRKGKNGTLKVIDPGSKLGNQTLLNGFISQWALDAPKFLRSSAKEKAEALLNIIGVGDELRRLDKQHDDLYGEREAHGRVTTQKEKYAAELPFHKGTPEVETSAVELIEEIRKVNAANAANAKQREQLRADNETISDRNARFAELEGECKEDERKQRNEIAACEQRLAAAKRELAALETDHEQRITDAKGAIRILCGEYETEKAIVAALTDRPTDSLNADLANCEETNARVRANAEKKAATAEGVRLRGEYAELTGKIEDTRAARIALLDNADLPLPGLGINAGELTYDGQPWDGMATSDQMKVAAAIASRENPECGFILLDGMETMDGETLQDFGEWATEHDLQVIGTRVSTGDECTLIIRDGEVVEEAGD